MSGLCVARTLSTNHGASCCAVVSCPRDVSVRNRPPLVSAASRLVSDLQKSVGISGCRKNVNEPGNLRREAYSEKLSHASDAVAHFSGGLYTDHQQNRISKSRR